MLAIAAQFDEGGRAYTYLTADQGFEVGDFAVVPAASRYDYPKVVKVVEIDRDFKMPDPAPFQYKCVIVRIPATSVA